VHRAGHLLHAAFVGRAEPIEHLVLDRRKVVLLAQVALESGMYRRVEGGEVAPLRYWIPLDRHVPIIAIPCSRIFPDINICICI
jgi:hypothetical protein